MHRRDKHVFYKHANVELGLAFNIMLSLALKRKKQKICLQPALLLKIILKHDVLYISSSLVLVY